MDQQRAYDQGISYLNSLERFRRFRVFLAEDVSHIDGRRSLQPAFALSESSMSGKKEMSINTHLAPLVCRLLALALAFVAALLRCAFGH